MEILGEQRESPNEIGILLADLERRIASGEKFFARQEMGRKPEDAQPTVKTKDQLVGSTVKSGMRTFFYLIDDVGESDCIYRYRPLSDYYSADSDGEMLQSPERMMAFNLVAIRTQYKYYICRPDDFGLDGSTSLPAYVELFSETVKYYNEYLKNTAFPAFYHKLQPYDMEPNDATIFRARQASLRGEDIGKACGLHVDLPDVIPSFSEVEVMRFVCNGVSPEDAASREFVEEDVINKYRTYKSENAVIQKLIGDPDLVSTEERTLWNAVASQPNDARTLTVTFQFRGRAESLQIKPEAIREVILNRVSFKPADIAPSSRSDFFAMGAAPWSNGEKSTLTYDHITKISYWDTVLYDKASTQQKEEAGQAAQEPDVEESDRILNRRSALHRR